MLRVAADAECLPGTENREARSAGHSGTTSPWREDHVTRGRRGWAEDFPIREEVEDHAGRRRAFVINCHEGGLGFTVRAEEEGSPDAGYQFAAYSETSPYSALGRLRQKMRRGVATRHLTGSSGANEMLHDKLSGRITSDSNGDLVLVVDGKGVGIENLVAMLLTHEGWEFELQIVDALE
jgi:hypothetical protein